MKKHRVIKYFLLITGFAVIIFIGIFAFRNVSNIILNSEKIEQSSIFIRTVYKLEINVLEIRTARRSYALTHDTSYINEYYKYNKLLDDNLNELHVINTNNNYEYEIIEIKNLLEKINDNNKRSFSINKSDSGWNEIQKSITIENEKNYWRIKDILVQIGDRELNDIRTKYTASREYYENSAYMITSGSVFAILFFYLLMYVYFRRYENQRNETEKANKELKDINKELTQLKLELEQRVEQRTAQLKRVNEELDSYNHSVAHELLNPLTAINSLSASLTKKETIPEEDKEHIKIIKKSSKHLIDIIRELLQLSTGNVLHSEETVNIKHLADNILQGIEQFNNKVKFIIPDELPPTKGNHVMIKQVLNNYINNAIKFSSLNEQPVIEIGHIPDESEYIYYVKDNGVGFDMKYYDKMFNVFQRFHTEKEFIGNGIGLSLSKRIIHKHGGRVWAEGKPGNGACFYFSLPKN